MFYNTLLLGVIAEKRQIKKFYKKVDGPLKCLVGVIYPSPRYEGLKLTLELGLD